MVPSSAGLILIHFQLPPQFSAYWFIQSRGERLYRVAILRGEERANVCDERRVQLSREGVQFAIERMICEQEKCNLSLALSLIVLLIVWSIHRWELAH